VHRIIQGLATQHDWRFMVLAAVVCAGGIATAISLIGMGREAAPRALRLYRLSGVLVLALSIWSSHFIAMVGYDPGFPIRYLPSGVLLSLAATVIGLAGCVALSRRGASWTVRICGRLIGTGAIAAGCRAPAPWASCVRPSKPCPTAWPSMTPRTVWCCGTPATPR
jgi:NO-binding membrane sensor protein with MHYT domain